MSYVLTTSFWLFRKAGVEAGAHLEPDVIIWVDQNTVVDVGSGRMPNIF